MRPSLASSLLAATLALSFAACLETKPVTNAGGATAAPGASAAPSDEDPDVASLRKATAGGGWKDFYILSPEGSQTDDPSLPLRLVRVEKLHHGHIGVAFDLENRRDGALDLGQVTASLVDEDERAMKVLAKPSGSVAPEGNARLVWIFDASDASKGSLEVRMDVPGTKAWPVVFSKDKPPDFKPTPNPEQSGPQAPGLGGPPGY